MAEEDQNMDDILYRAARLKGSAIPCGVNFRSRTSGDHNNAFHVAAQYDNHEFIRGALAQVGESYFDLLWQKNSKGQSTPLHLAAQSGHLETVKVLIEAHNCGHEKRICWRERDSKGDTPLHKALIYRNEDIAVLMLDNERDLCSLGLDGNINNYSLASAVNNVGESLAYLAAENFCLVFLCKLLEAYEPDVVSLTGYQGQTVLHSARRFTSEYMWWLIETVGRSMLKKQDESGKTVVHYAVEENKVAMVEELLKVDTSLACLRDRAGLTPLDVAFKNGLFPMVKIILESSPQSVEIRDEHSRSPLHYTKMDRDFLEKCRIYIDDSILKLLISGVDDDGNTPFHVALINSEQDAANELLMVQGCSWSLRNKDGYNPWDLCKSNDNIPHTCTVYDKLSTINSGAESLGRRDWLTYKYFKSKLCTINLEGMEDEDCEKLLNKIAIVATLLLPLNFAAAFSVPGGYDSTTGVPILRNHRAYRVYIMSNITAFLATMFILIMCTLGVGIQAKMKRFVRFSIALLQIALLATCTAYTFGLAVTGVAGPLHTGQLPTYILIGGTGLVVIFLIYNYNG